MSRIRIDDLSAVATLNRAEMERTQGALFGLLRGLIGLPFFRRRQRRRNYYFGGRNVFGPGYGSGYGATPFFPF